MPYESYTVTSLIESLESIKGPVDAVAQEAFDLSKDSRSNAQADDQIDAYHGLWRELHDLSMALEAYLKRLQSPGNDAKPAALPTSPPILENFKAMVEALQPGALESLSLETVLETKSKALWFQRTISNGSSWTDNQNGLLFYLSLLPSKPSRDFQALEVPAAEIRRWRSMRREQASNEVDSDIVSYWLTLLNADFNDREPEEYHREKIFVELRNQAIPDYTKAATQWPLHTGQFWAALRPQVFSLFNSSKSFNFVQWALEYARGTWPSIFGSESISAEPLMDLTDGLCSGAISPLHIACALGLPQLCRDLISSGSGINREGPLGTPLLCALLGCSAFEGHFSQSPWVCPRDAATYANAARSETILLLLDSGANCASRCYSWFGKKSSIIGPAFWASLATQDESILRRIKEAGAEMDGALAEILQYPEVETQISQNKKHASFLLTYLFDAYLVKDSSLSEGDVGGMQGLMNRQGLTFACKDGQGELEGLSLGALHELTDQMMAISWAFGLKRLTLDPRFDPNRLLEESEDTLLHNAVSADSLDIVDVLIEAGADTKTAGAQGRTPVMVVESSDMLEKLVKQYGATTTDLDWEGRNIWHYAAATNDMPLLDWLCNNDPWKAENLEAETDFHLTPLAEAFCYVQSLHSQPLSMRSNPEPLAARKLLGECHDSSSLSSPIPLTHLAAAWADMELINGLEALGANFRELDDEGASAMHLLNFSASVEVVTKLQKLCAGVPIQSDRGRTPAEEIFVNFTPLLENNYHVLSAHPSCRHPLSEEVFELLLSPAAIDSIDFRNNTFWERFMKRVIEPNLLYPQMNSTKCGNLIHRSITAAINCLIRAGAMADYEQTQDHSAVYSFFQGWFDEPVAAVSNDERQPVRWWNLQYYQVLIMTVLEHSAPEMLEKFYPSVAAVQLLREAAIDNKMNIVRHLTSHGVPVASSGTVADGTEYKVEDKHMHDVSPIEYVILFCPGTDRLGELLKEATFEQLTDRQQDLFNAVLDHTPAYQQNAILAMLLQNGMDPNVMRSEAGTHGTHSILSQALLDERPELAKTLLDHGADPKVGRGTNAVFCAAVFGYADILKQILAKEKTDFPWTATWRRYGVEENLLTTAARARCGGHEFLTVLLEGNERTGLVSQINDLLDGVTSIHMAATLGRVKYLRLLHEYGGNMSIRDGKGRTPLHAACSSRLGSHVANLELDAVEDEDQNRYQTIRMLGEVCPESAGMKDNDGKLPHELIKVDGEVTIVTDMLKPIVAAAAAADADPAPDPFADV